VWFGGSWTLYPDRLPPLKGPLMSQDRFVLSSHSRYWTRTALTSPDSFPPTRQID
jgi:hypothetical protein